MKTRRIGPFEVAALGLGCMNLSHGYGTPPPEEAAQALLRGALDLGIAFFDTAALYGFGANEELIGRTLAADRSKFVLASKCGLHGVDGKRVVDGRPETLKWSCEQSLKRLRTDRIDLFYLHRWDRNVPIEDSVGAMADLVRAGHIRAIGLSEVSVATLTRAQAVHPITAVQSEYSPWTRNPELGMLAACESRGIAFVAFSPVARGFQHLHARAAAVEERDERDRGVALTVTHWVEDQAKFFTKRTAHAEHKMHFYERLLNGTEPKIGSKKKAEAAAAAPPGPPA